MTPAIQTFDLSIGYPQKKKKAEPLHKDINLSLYPGELTCLLGLNGAGKSTLLRTLCGMQPALSGEVHLMGKPLQLYSQRAFSLTMGVVLTDRTNAGGLTVRELVSLGRHPHTNFLGKLNREDWRIVEQAMDDTGISHKADQYVSQLSDGERQKAMIAKTLAQQCPIILLDEPTAFLDITARMEAMVLLHRIASQQGKTILLSTHDLDSAIQMGDCLWLLQRGRNVQSGMTEELILRGAFDAFFDKKNIHFDLPTGKLSILQENPPIGVSGDATLAFWMGNALQRNGFSPVPPAADLPSVECLPDGSFLLALPDVPPQPQKTMKDLLLALAQGHKRIL